jgi:hypothetical protein
MSRVGSRENFRNTMLGEEAKSLSKTRGWKGPGLRRRRFPEIFPQYGSTVRSDDLRRLLIATLLCYFSSVSGNHGQVLRFPKKSPSQNSKDGSDDPVDT